MRRALFPILLAIALTGCIAEETIHAPEGPADPGVDESGVEQIRVDPDHMALRHVNSYPTRVAQGEDGRIFVSDAKTGSVFVYSGDLEPLAELPGFDRPLGVAVDRMGRVYVGDDSRDSVEVYGPDGHRIFKFDRDVVMPNDIALAIDGTAFVVDSRSDVVRVFNSEGEWLFDVGGSGDGDGQLSFPSAITIHYPGGPRHDGELLVADLGNARVQVFDLQGRFLRGFGQPIEAFSTQWQGRFGKLQSLAVDESGRLHAVDTYTSKIQILDPGSGEFLDSYGEFGTEIGQLNLPLDILITHDARVVVANSENHRVEVFHEIQ